jgi:hypothetical protein
MTLDDEDLAAIADALAPLIAEALAGSGNGAQPDATGRAPREHESVSRLVTAAEVAAMLSVTRDTVYAHAAELGAVRIGDGPRPRLRFDPEKAVAAWASHDARANSQAITSRAAGGTRRGRPRRSMGTDVPLLPIRGRKAA